MMPLSYSPLYPRAAIALAMAFLGAAAAEATDWPCYRADASRSGASAETLTFPLAPVWNYTPGQPPAPAWPDSHWEENRLAFDHAFAPVIANGLVLFGSSADDTIRALRLSDGTERWAFTTGGPVRFAPQVVGNRCYAAGDDGFVYCLNAADGARVWSARLAFDERLVIGHGRLISRWPCRTGVLVDHGIVYATAGMWPTEGIVVAAFDAATGKELWRNDTAGYYYRKQPYSSAYAFGGVAPQGYLMLAGDVLLVPTGRSVPAGFDRATGRLLHCRASGATDRDGAAWGLAIGATTVSRLWAGHRLSGALLGLRAESGSLAWNMPRLHWPAVVAQQTLYAPASDGRLAAHPVAAAGRPAPTPTWSVPHAVPLCMAAAGETLLLGGTNWIAAVRARDGQPVWQQTIAGQARELAVGDGHVVAALASGTLVCFAAGAMGQSHTIVSPPPTLPPVSEATATLVRALPGAGREAGYALVLGDGDARRAEELAAATRLNIVCALIDPARVESERRRLLTSSGVYGARVTVLTLTATTPLPFPPYLANLIVLGSGAGAFPPAEVYRALRPCGGILAAPEWTPETAAQWVTAAGIPPAEIRSVSRPFIVARGKLPGAFDWDARESADARVKWPLELTWFGGPDPDRMVETHQIGFSPHIPIPANGRTFMIGASHVMAVDAYNGAELWAHEIGHTIAWRDNEWRHPSTGFPLAADDRHAYLTFGDVTLQLDALTGQALQRYGALAPSPAYALTEPLRIERAVDATHAGAATFQTTERGLAVDLWTRTPTPSKNDGWHLAFDFRPAAARDWRYAPGVWMLWLQPSAGTNARTALWRKIAGPWAPELALTRAATTDATRVTFEIPWDAIRQAAGAQPTDFTCAGIFHAGMAAGKPPVQRPLFGDLIGGMVNNGWGLFRLPGAATGGAPHALAAMPAGDPATLPAYARTWGRLPKAERATNADLTTRAHPLTDLAVPKTYVRSKGCGGIGSAAFMDFFRSGTVGFYDWLDDSGVRNFGGIRSACGFTSFSPAHGVVVAADSGAGCQCSYNFQGAFGLAPSDRRRNEDWALFLDPLAKGPVRTLALNFGAPGDRRDPSGRLWLGLPRPQEGTPGGAASDRLSQAAPARLEWTETPGLGPYRVHADRLASAGTDRPWVYAGGIRGIRHITIPLDLAEPLVVPLATTPPALDGRTNDACWTGAGEALCAERPQARVWLRHDDHALYVLYVCPPTFDRKGQRLPWTRQSGAPSSAAGGDTPVWEEEAFEIYLADTGTRQAAHLGVGSSGGRYDALCIPVARDAQPEPEDPAFGGVWTSVVQTTNTLFTVEMAIPWTLTAEAKLPRDGLRLAFRAGTREKSRPPDPDLFQPLVLRGAAPAPTRAYTLRLHFADLDATAPGQRVFDVRAQGLPVLTGFDIVKEAGGPARAVVREYRGIQAADRIEIAFASAAHPLTATNAPLICGLELVAEAAGEPSRAIPK